MLEEIKKDYDKWLENLWNSYSINEDTDIEEIIEKIEDEIEELNNKINNDILQDKINEYLESKIDDLSNSLSDLKDLLFKFDEYDDNDSEIEFLLQEAREIFTEQIS